MQYKAQDNQSNQSKKPLDKIIYLTKYIDQDGQKEQELTKIMIDLSQSTLSETESNGIISYNGEKYKINLTNSENAKDVWEEIKTIKKELIDETISSKNIEDAISKSISSAIEEIHNKYDAKFDESIKKIISSINTKHINDSRKIDSIRDEYSHAVSEFKSTTDNFTSIMKQYLKDAEKASKNIKNTDDDIQKIKPKLDNLLSILNDLVRD